MWRVCRGNAGLMFKPRHCLETEQSRTRGGHDLNIIDVPRTTLNGAQGSDIESPPNPHVGILVIRDVVRNLRPRRIGDGIRSILPNGVPVGTIVDLNDAVHVRRNIRTEPPLENQMHRWSIGRIEGRTRQVIIPMHGRAGTSTDVDPSDHVVGTG